MTRITAAEATRRAQAYLDAEGRDQVVVHAEIAEDDSGTYAIWRTYRGADAWDMIIDSRDLRVDAETGETYMVYVVTGERLPSPVMADRP